jgi:hypothetical protein
MTGSGTGNHLFTAISFDGEDCRVGVGRSVQANLRSRGEGGVAVDATELGHGWSSVFLGAGNIPLSFGLVSVGGVRQFNTSLRN